jgi:hypothetical protein
MAERTKRMKPKAKKMGVSKQRALEVEPVKM